MNPRLSEAVLQNAELNIREMKEKKTVLSSMPYKIFVEPTQRCNLRCFMCWNERRQIRDDLDLTLFETIEKTLFPLAAEVDFFLVGEPLLAKHFPVMIESAERHTFVPKIFTNALIYKNDIYRRLIELGFFVNISMDAASKRLYDRIRIGGDYEVFQANVRRIMARAEAMANPRFHVRICATIGSYNVSEVRGIVEFAREVGIRDVMVNDCDMGPPHPHNMCNMREEARVMLGECLALASEHRIRFSFPRYIGGEVLLEKNHNWDDFRLPIDDHAPDFLERYKPGPRGVPVPLDRDRGPVRRDRGRVLPEAGGDGQPRQTALREDLEQPPLPELAKTEAILRLPGILLAGLQLGLAGRTLPAAAHGLSGPRRIRFDHSSSHGEVF